MQSGHRHLSHFLYIEVFKNRQFYLFCSFCFFLTRSSSLVFVCFFFIFDDLLPVSVSMSKGQLSCVSVHHHLWNSHLRDHHQETQLKFHKLHKTNYRGDYGDYDDDSSWENKRGPPCCCKAIPLSADLPPPQRLRKKSDKWKCRQCRLHHLMHRPKFYIFAEITDTITALTAILWQPR